MCDVEWLAQSHNANKDMALGFQPRHSGSKACALDYCLLLQILKNITYQLRIITIRKILMPKCFFCWSDLFSVT